MSRALVVSVIVLSAVVINQSAVHWRSNIADDHLFSYFGWCITQGATPYLDFWDNKPPGIFYLNALAIELFGPTRAADLAICGVAMVVTLAATVQAARVAFHAAVAPLAAIVAAVVLTDQRFESGGNRTETFVVVCEIVCVLGYLLWRTRGVTAWLLLASVAGGAAPLFKQSGVSAAAACLLHAILVCLFSRTGTRQSASTGCWKCWIVAAIAFVTPATIAITALGPRAAREGWFAVVTFNRAYFAIDDASWIRVDRSLEIYRPVLEPIAPVLFVALAGIVLGAWNARPRRSAPAPPGDEFSLVGDRGRSPVGAWWLFAIWFVISMYLACVAPGRRGHHMMPALTPLALLVCGVAATVVRPAGLRVTMVRSATRAALVVALLAFIAPVSISNVDELARSWSMKREWYSLEYASPPGFVLQGRVIEANTSPSDRIFVWGWDPGAYRYALRLPASRYATFEKLGQVGVHAQFIFDGAIHDLYAAPPAAFLMSPNDYTGLANPKDQCLRDWLDRNYSNTGATAGMLIFVRNRPSVGDRNR